VLKEFTPGGSALAELRKGRVDGSPSIISMESPIPAAGSIQPIGAEMPATPELDMEKSDTEFDASKVTDGDACWCPTSC